jgi:hypothetical protein
MTAGFMHTAVRITHHSDDRGIVFRRMARPEKGRRHIVLAQKFKQTGRSVLDAIVKIGETANIGFHIKTENHIKSAVHSQTPEKFC